MIQSGVKRNNANSNKSVITATSYCYGKRKCVWIANRKETELDTTMTPFNPIAASKQHNEIMHIPSLSTLTKQHLLKTTTAALFAINLQFIFNLYLSSSNFYLSSSNFYLSSIIAIQTCRLSSSTKVGPLRW